MGFSQFSQFRSQSGFSLDWVFFSPYLCTGIQGNEAVSVAPASPGKHLAARLETPSDVLSLKNKKVIWEQRTIHQESPASWEAS